MRILTEQCATCIFRPSNLMHLREGRVKQMITDCQTYDTHVPCHETMEYDDSDEEGNAVGVTDGSPVCRGFYDRYPGVGQMIRISERLNLVEFTPPPGVRLRQSFETRSRKPPRPRSTSGSRHRVVPGQ